MTVHRTIGDLLDAGVTWDQIHTTPDGGDPLYSSAAEAEAHRDDPVADWVNGDPDA